MIVAFIATVAVAQERTPADALMEPFPIRDQFLLSSGFLFLEPTTSRVLPDETWSLDLRYANSNTFAKSAWLNRRLEGTIDRHSTKTALNEARDDEMDSVFLVAGETHRLMMRVRRGIGDRFEVGLSVPVVANGGGWSDALIENFHRVLDLGGADRQSLPRNTEIIYVRTPTVHYIRQRSAGTALGDVALTGKYELRALEDDKFAIAVEAAVELPTGNAQTLNGSGSVDGGMQMLITRRLTRTTVHVSLGVLWLGASAPLGTKRQELITDTVGVSHLVTDATAATLQLTVSETPFRSLGIPEFGRRSCQLSTGLQHRLGLSVIHLAVIENVFNFNNSADFGFEAGVSRRF